KFPHGSPLSLKMYVAYLFYETRHGTVPPPKGTGLGNRERNERMSSRVLTPAALAIALVFGAAPFGAPLAQAAQHGQVASVAPTEKVVHAIRLSTGMVDGKMVFLDAEGKPNPRLEARVGDTIEITIGSGEGAQHDIAIPELGIKSELF